MKIAPLQYFGTGDVHFCQTIANKWIGEGHEVVWGVLPHFVEGLNRAFPKVKFVDYRTLPIDYNRMDEHDSNGYRVIPLRWSVELMGVPYKDCMKSKYMLFDMDWRTWKDGAMWKRDEGKEDEVYSPLIGQKYRFINTMFGSDMTRGVNIPRSNEVMNIVMTHNKNYSLFDYAKVLENATEIHTVSTSIIYLLECLELKAKEVHLYQRPIKGQEFDNVDYILQRHSYVFHK